MKYISLLLLSTLIFSNEAYSQKSNEIYFSFDSTSFDNPPLTKKRLEIDGKILKVIKDDTTRKIVSEFLRIDNKIYYYSETDFSGNNITEGKAIIETQPFRKFKVPITDSNGNIIRYKRLDFYKFSKIGEWVEYVSDSLERFGNYFNNKKAGTWRYIKTLKKGYGKKIEVKKEIYKNDELIKTEKLNLLEINPKIVSTAILGTWTFAGRRFF